MPTIVVVLGPIAVQINKMQMKPRLMVAALVIWSQAQRFARDGESTMFVHFPETLRAR